MPSSRKKRKSLHRDHVSRTELEAYQRRLRRSRRNALGGPGSSLYDATLQHAQSVADDAPRTERLSRRTRKKSGSKMTIGDLLKKY